MIVSIETTTTEALAAALREQQQVIAQLRSEIDELRRSLSASGAPEAPEAGDRHESPDGSAVSRRKLLTKAAAGLAVGAGVLAARPTAAAAATGDPLLVGRSNAATSTTYLSAATVGDGFWVEKSGTGSTVVAGTSYSDTVGVYGRSSGFSGQAYEHAGVLGVSSTKPGVAGQSKDQAALKGTSTNSHGCFATTAATNEGIGGVRGETTNANSGSAGVIGHAAGTGPGVFGRSVKGIGGTFDGAAAPLRLIPKTVAGAPKSGAHKAGEIVLDNQGVLWVCKTAGTPGVWKKVGT